MQGFASFSLAFFTMMEVTVLVAMASSLGKAAPIIGPPRIKTFGDSSLYPPAAWIKSVIGVPTRTSRLTGLLMPSPATVT